MATDDIRVDDEQPTSSSEGEQTPSEGSEAVKTPEGGDSIPYARFKDVITQRDELKKRIEALEQQQPQEKEPEPTTWKEAKERAVKEAVSEMERRAKESAKADYEQEQKIEKSFQQLEAMGQKVTPAIKKAVLTKIIKTGDNDVLGAYLQVKDKTAKTQKTEQRKKEGFVPPSQKGSAAGKPGITYKELRGMSLDDLVERTGEAK